jgi:hypothetical protein
VIDPDSGECRAPLTTQKQPSRWGEVIGMWRRE